jgi:spermidine/putrescine-binding protein
MKGRRARIARWAAFALLIGALSVVAAGCGGGDDEDAASTEIEGLGGSLEEIQELAREEGQVNLVQWPGYSVLTDEFTAATGCKVNTKGPSPATPPSA